MNTPSIDIKFQPSVISAWLLGMICLLAFLAIITTALTFIIKLLLFVATTFYANKLLQKDVLLKSADSLIGIKMHYGKVVIKTNSQLIPVTVAGDSVVTAKLSILRFKDPTGKKSKTYLIFKDSTPDYRKLTVALRYLSYGS